jgi:CheY-like chemotaxis protein
MAGMGRNPSRQQLGNWPAEAIGADYTRLRETLERKTLSGRCKKSNLFPGLPHFATACFFNPQPASGLSIFDLENSLKYKDFLLSQTLANLLLWYRAKMVGGKESNSMARILVIEDDEEMRSLLEDFLKGEGYEAESALNGFEGLRKLAQETFDLVLTDVRMPGLTGLEILAAIKKVHPEVPVMVITAFGSEEIHRRSLERGASGYLEKPIRFPKLKALISQLVSPQREKEVRGGMKGMNL